MNKIKGKIAGGFLSSTMWFGFVIMLVQWLENNTEMLAGLVDSQYQSLVGYGIGILIWFFRWITTIPLEEKVTDRVTDDGVDATTRLNDALAEEDPNHS